MKNIAMIISELINFFMNFPLFAIGTIFLLIAIISLFSNWALAVGGFSFTVVLFLGQIIVNRTT